MYFMVVQSYFNINYGIMLLRRWNGHRRRTNSLRCAVSAHEVQKFTPYRHIVIGLKNLTGDF